MNQFAMSALADEHIRDMHAAAARSRLIALARCCRPTTWHRAATRARAAVAAVAEWVRRDRPAPARTYCACS